jgi:hypothetical protein
LFVHIVDLSVLHVEDRLPNDGMSRNSVRMSEKISLGRLRSGEGAMWGFGALEKKRSICF